MRERTQSQLRSAIEAIDPNEKDHPERRKVSDLYASFMDEAGVEQAGLTSLREPLAKIHALRDKGDLPALFADLARLWIRIPFALDVSPDEHDATTYVVHLHQGRLGLPDRDYFLKDDAHFKGMRSACRAHIARLFALAGEGGGEPAADNIIGLETALAHLQWTRVENRDPVRTYNKTDVAALPALVAKDDLRTYLAAAGVGGDITTVIAAQPSFLAGLSAVFADTPLETFKAYLTYNLLSSYSGYLSAQTTRRSTSARATLPAT